MKCILGILFGALLLAGPLQAQSLFYDSCAGHLKRINPVSFAPGVLTVLTLQDGAYGLSCKDVRALTKGARAIEIALMPALLALKLSSAPKILAGELAALGLTYSNPAVLGITVIGATGVAVFYIVLNQTMEECDRLDQRRLEEAVLLELERKYEMNPRGIPVTRRKK